MIDDGWRDERGCHHRGKVLEDFSDLGCEYRDTRHPGFGVYRVEIEGALAVDSDWIVRFADRDRPGIVYAEVFTRAQAAGLAIGDKGTIRRVASPTWPPGRWDFEPDPGNPDRECPGPGAKNRPVDPGKSSHGPATSESHA